MERPLDDGIAKSGGYSGGWEHRIIKPPSDASLALIEAGKAFEEADFPAGVVNIVTGPGTTVGETLARHPGVDMISVIGSTATGVQLMELASSAIKKLALELGGKSPNIIFADANLEKAVEWARAAAFNNQGEICVSGSRLLLQEEIHDEFLKQLVGQVNRFKIGFSTESTSEIGPLINRAQQGKVLDHVKTGLQGGAELVGGGEIPEQEHLQKGNFVLPAIFDRVQPVMRIAQEEISGPVLSGLTFQGEQEAVRIANGVEYGLAEAVFTRVILPVPTALPSSCGLGKSTSTRITAKQWWSLLALVGKKAEWVVHGSQKTCSQKRFLYPRNRGYPIHPVKWIEPV